MSEDQHLLAESVERFLSNEYAFEKRARAICDGGYSQASWQKFADLGWLAIALPESAGGLGGDPVDVMNIMRQMGRYLVIEPFLSTVVLGARLIHEGLPGDPSALLAPIVAGKLHVAVATQEAEFGANTLKTVATRTASGYCLSGFKPVVINAAIAQKLVIPARIAGEGRDAPPALFLLDRAMAGVAITPFLTHDGRNAGAITLDKVMVQQSDRLTGGGPDLFGRAMAHGAAAQCADSVGAAERLFETTSEYLKERSQFGRRLAEFQVVQHALVDMYVALELGRSMAFVAARLVADWRKDHNGGLAAACYKVDRASQAIANAAVQLHGGMGVSEDHHVAHYFKRIMVNTAMLGDSSYWLKRYLDATELCPAEQGNAAEPPRSAASG
ncbi:acyl-CoA dehydrogenase family protein [Novosphingobium sp. BL-52-GroH]|uniref:acyl-CoA dehydrogenase family protein n=1 Tax=Novosphingobium sp. BL-52-GroH TaxID=3349877 RepID=UPI00384B0267